MDMRHLRRIGIPSVTLASGAAPSQGSFPAAPAARLLASPKFSAQAAGTPTTKVAAVRGLATAAKNVAVGVVHDGLLPACYVDSIPKSDEQILRFLLVFLKHEGLEYVHVYINGGYIRDLLLGKEPDDLDLSLCLRDCPQEVTVAGLLDKVPGFAIERPDLCITEVKVATILSNESKDKQLDTFKAYFYNTAGNKTEVDVMPTIGEEKYEEGNRIPIRDERGLPEQDALRRDLTVGAMLLRVDRSQLDTSSSLSYQLLDFYGGAEDLRRGILRAPFPAGRNQADVAPDILRTPAELELARALGLNAREDAEAVQILWWAKILMDDPLRACRALRFCAKLKGFCLHDAFWEAMPFALHALQSKVAGSRKNTEYQKMGGYGFNSCMEFFELAFTKTFGPGSTPNLRLAPALFGGQDDKGKARTMSDLDSFDLDGFRRLAECLRPEEGRTGLDAADLIGSLLAAAIAATKGLAGSPQDEFARACDGMSVSNTMREAGFSPLRVASRWIAEPLQANALDSSFAPICGVEPELLRLYTQVWQDFQLPGSTAFPSWSQEKRGLTVALAHYCASDEDGRARAAIVAAAGEVVGRSRPAVKGSALSAPGVIEVPPQLRRQVLSLLEVSLRLLGNTSPVETGEQLEELFQAVPLLREALSETILAELAPKPTKKAKDGKKK